MELVLHRVSARGSINLEGVVDSGVEFYTAQRNDDGTVVLTPVAVRTPTAKREHPDPSQD